MPRSFEMTWVENKKLWRKVYRGKTYTVSCKQLREQGHLPLRDTKEGSYIQANAWWHTKEFELAAQERAAQRPPVPLEDAVVPLLEHLRKGQMPQEELLGRPLTEEDRLRDLQWGARMLFELYVLKGVPLPPEVLPKVPHPTMAALENLRGQVAAPGRTAGEQAVAWLKGQELRMAAREISPGGYDNKRRWLDKFLDFVGRTTDVVLITDDLLEKFDAHCLERRAKHVEGREGGWSDITVDEARGAAREWVGWLADHNVIPRPAWLSRRRRSFRVLPRDIKPWTPAQFRAVLAATYRDEVKLIFLLGANAGMTQKDCTDLRPDEVDWEAGYVERRRSKSAHVKNTPVVRYKLWPVTLDLLRKCHRGGDRVITTRDGTPYVNERFVGGKRVRVDSFHRHFQRVKGRLAESLPDFDGTPKGVRKMSATLLASHPTYGRFVSHFLGHSPRSIADRHYARPDQALFDQAVTWLGKQLGQA
jgi:integrase